MGTTTNWAFINNPWNTTGVTKDSGSADPSAAGLPNSAQANGWKCEPQRALAAVVRAARWRAAGGARARPARAFAVSDSENAC